MFYGGVLQGSYRLVTKVLLWVTRVLKSNVTGLLQVCYKDVARVLQGCSTYKGVTLILQGCYRDVTVTLKGYYSVLKV